MINIAIDGTTSSGKSSLAYELSKRLNFKRLDTGAIYRGVACAFERQGLKEVNEENVDKLLQNISINILFEGTTQHVIVNDIDETENLRTEKISLLTSLISPYKKVRDRVILIQRDFAEKNDCVMEGRDITTVVLPNADVKFYITASLEERAKRRYLQYASKKEGPSFEEVLQDIKVRDERDENRKYGKLEIAKDSIVIDTTEKNLEEVVDICYKIVINKIKK